MARLDAGRWTTMGFNRLVLGDSLPFEVSGSDVNRHVLWVWTVDLAERGSGREPPVGGFGSVRALCGWNGGLIIGTARDALLLFEPDWPARVAPAGRRLLVQGPPAGCVALEMHPEKHLCLTVCGDAELRCWNLDRPDGPSWVTRLAALNRFVEPEELVVSCLTIVPDGTSAALGFAGGFIWVLALPDDSREAGFAKDRSGQELHVELEGTRGITALRYRPDGRLLAAGSVSGRLVLLEAVDPGGALAYRALRVLVAQSAPLIAIDFARDGASLQAADSTGRLVTWRLVNTSNGGIESSFLDSAVAADIPWLTWSSPVGWPVLGLNMPAASLSRDPAGPAIAVGLESGDVLLAPLPWLQFSSAASYSAHLGQALVSFGSDGAAIASAGRCDRALILWALPHILESSDAHFWEEEQSAPPAEGLVVRLVLVGADANRLGQTAASLAAVLGEAVVERLGEEAAGRLRLFGYGRIGSCTADLQLLPHSTGWATQPDPAAMLAELRALLAGDVMRRRLRAQLKVQVGAGVELVGGEGAAAGKDDLLEASPTWRGKMCAPSDWSELGGSTALGYPPVRWLGPVEPPGPAVPTLDSVLTWVPRRSGLKFTGSDRVTWVAGTSVVVQDKERRQNFFRHPAVVGCLIVGEGRLVTGDAGPPGLLRVWALERPTSPVELGGSHPEGVAKLALMGRDRLVSLGAGPVPLLAVWQLEEATLLAIQNVGPGLVMSLGGGLEQVVTAGRRHLRFWRLAPDGLVASSPQPLAAAASSTFLCVAAPNALGRSLGPAGEEICVTGAENGSISLWQGRTCAMSLPAHPGGVLDLCFLCRTGPSDDDLLVSGGADMTVGLWTVNSSRIPFIHSLRKVSWPFAASFGGIVSVDAVMNFDAQAECNMRLLVAPAIGPAQLMELNLDSEHHNWNELLEGQRGGGWLCTSDFGAEAVSVGSDGILRYWDIPRRRCLLALELGVPGSAVDWAPLAAEPPQLAVGSTSGILILNTEQLRDSIRSGAARLAEGAWDHLILARLGRQMGSPEALSYGLDGSKLAAAFPTALVVYSAGGAWHKIAATPGPGPARLDWASSGIFLRGVGPGADLRVWKLELGNRSAQLQQVTPLSTRDVPWSSYRCGLCWELQAAAQAAIVSGEALVVTERTHAGGVLFAGTPLGQLRAYPFPALPGAEANTVAAHAGGVVAIRMAYDDSWAVTTGSDGTTFLWTFDGFATHGSDTLQKIDEINNIEEVAEIEDPSLRAYLSSALAPTRADIGTDGFSGAPDDELELIMVHGFSYFKGRRLAAFNARGDLVWAAGRLVVVQKGTVDPDRPGPAGYIQHFFSGHWRHVTALAGHPDGCLFASADDGRGPIRVWDSLNLERGSGFNRSFEVRGIATLGEGGPGAAGLAFGGRTGELLCRVGRDPLQTLQVWDWVKNHLLAVARCGPGAGKDVAWGDGDMITCGQGQVLMYRTSI
mmetsp:Transcript_3501/g.10104  ORF Transcript_3501/g.10104 Transcript_3501/m.10104 type:complete len:1454 (+) Transcript_3501:856-5217(+)